MLRDWELFRERIGKGQMHLLAYGWDEVRIAAERGAVKALFCPEDEGREEIGQEDRGDPRHGRGPKKREQELIKRIERANGRCHFLGGRAVGAGGLFSQLTGFGVAALLRFPLQETVDDVDDSDEGEDDEDGTFFSGGSSPSSAVPSADGFASPPPRPSVHKVPGLLFQEDCSGEETTGVMAPTGAAFEELEVLQSMYTGEELAVRGDCLKLLLRAEPPVLVLPSKKAPLAYFAPIPGLLLELAVPCDYPATRPMFMLSAPALPGSAEVSEAQLEELRSMLQENLTENEGETGMLLGAWWLCRDWLADNASSSGGGGPSSAAAVLSKEVEAVPGPGLVAPPMPGSTEFHRAASAA